jgi:hypothetical protein
MSFGQHDAVLHKTSIRLANRNTLFIEGSSTETREIVPQTRGVSVSSDLAAWA